MNTTPPTSGPEDARTARLRAVVDELLDMGMDIARILHRQVARAAETAHDAATAALPPRPDRADAQDLTLQFDRVARAIRRTVALSRALDAPPVPVPAPAPAPASGQADPTAARKRILREVEDSIQSHAEGPAAEHLRTELAERMDARDLEDDIAARPVADIIADITRDLGIEAMQGFTRWKRRAPAELAHLAARAARRPGDPALPEPAPRPDPPPLPRSRRTHPAAPPPLIRQALAALAAHEAGTAPRPGSTAHDRAGAPPFPPVPPPA